MIPDCGGCREAIRTAVRVESRPDCGAPQPNRAALCERPEGHDGEHRAELNPGHTYCYWRDAGPLAGLVAFRPIDGGWRD